MKNENNALLSLSPSVLFLLVRVERERSSFLLFDPQSRTSIRQLFISTRCFDLLSLSSNTSPDEKSKYHRAFLWEGAMQRLKHLLATVQQRDDAIDQTTGSVNFCQSSVSAIELRGHHCLIHQQTLHGCAYVEIKK